MGIIIALTVLPEKTHAAVISTNSGTRGITSVSTDTYCIVGADDGLSVDGSWNYIAIKTNKPNTSVTYQFSCYSTGGGACPGGTRDANLTTTTDANGWGVFYDVLGGSWDSGYAVYVAGSAADDHWYGDTSAPTHCYGGNNTPPQIYLCDAESGCGGYAPPPPSNITTRIISVAPPDNTATTTQPTPTMTYWAASTTQLNVLNATIYRMDTGGNQVYATSTFIVPPSDDYATWITFGGQIWLADNASYKVVYSGYDEHNFAHNLIFSTTTTFYTGTNGWFETIGATSTATENLHALATSTCSVLNISGCFQNALVWAFIPSEDSMNALKNTGGSLATVKPFGYFVQMRAALSPSTTTAALVDLTQYAGSGTAWGILFFEPLKTILAIIFWVANLVMLYFYWRKKEV